MHRGPPERGSIVFHELKEMEDLLKCQICCEELKAPMLTSCSHFFCSLCIRKWLVTKQCCPICSSDSHDTELRKISVLENIASLLVKLKVKLDQKVPVDMLSSFTLSKKLERENVQHTDDRSECMQTNQPSTSKFETFTPSRTKVIIGRPKYGRSGIPDAEAVSSDGEEVASNIKSPVTSPSTPKEKKAAATSLQTPHFSPKETIIADKSTKALCPVCNLEVPFNSVNIHLDRCLEGGSKRSSVEARTPVVKKNAEKNPAVKSPSLSTAEHPKRLEPIKKFVLHLMSDGLLKKELKKYKLSTQGDRKTLSNRLQRFVVFYNAECDATHQRSLNELVQQFEKDEKALNTPASSTSVSQLFKVKPNDIEGLEKANAEYRKQNQFSFQKLIEQAGKTRSTERNAETIFIPSDTDSDVPKDKIVKNKTEMKSLSNDSNCESDDDFVSKPSVSKRRGRKYIDSETSEDDEVLTGTKRSTKKLKAEKSPNRVTSPVLQSKTPVRRALRSRASLNKSVEKTQGLHHRGRPPKSLQEASNEKKGKKQGKLKVVLGHCRPSSSSEKKDDIAEEESIEEKLRLTPDLFHEPASPASTSSSSFTCGQPVKRSSGQDEKEEDAVSQLVSLLDADNGSETDFEP